MSLARNGDDVEFLLCRDDSLERLIRPPPHFVDELAVQLRRLGRWRDRVADAWERWRGREVLSERSGMVRLMLGAFTAQMQYWVLPYRGGVCVRLDFFSGPEAAEFANEILVAERDILSEQVVA